MMHRRVLGIVAVSFVAGAAFAMFRPSAPTDGLGTVLPHLIERAAAAQQGTVAYRHYEMNVDAAGWQQLRAMLLSSQTSPSATISQAVDEWRQGLPAGVRHCCDGNLVFDGPTWCMRRTQNNGCDNSAAHLIELASTTGAKPMPGPKIECVRVADGEHTTITDNRAVVRRQAVAHAWPLEPIDVTLGPWSGAVNAPPVSGQAITSEDVGSRHRLVYQNVGAGGVAEQTVYEFDSDLAWAPMQVLMTRYGAVEEERFYGYAPSTDGQFRPAVSACGQFSGPDSIAVSLFVIDSWSAMVDPQQLQLRMPPMHVDIDLRLAGPPITDWVLPDYMAAVAPGEQLTAAIIAITQALGTSDPGRDFNADGIVDLADIQHVVGAMSE